MPAKKKTAVKKTPTKKAAKKAVKKVASKAVKKATVKAVKKATVKAVKKVAPKAVKKTKTKIDKPKVKKTPEKKTKKSKSATTSNTIIAKQQTRISMSMEEIRELLKKRAKEEAEAQKELKKKTPVVAKKIDDLEKVEVKNSRHSAASLDDILGLGVSATPQQKVPRKWKVFYDLLIQLRDEVRAEVTQHSNDTLKRSQKEEGGDVVTSSDAGTDTFDRDFALNILSNEKEALKEIEDAINRIYRGTYGVCEETGEAILEERLRVVPFTRYSLEGKKINETNSQKKVQRAGAFINDVNSEKISFGDDDGDS